ncbi:MULTISPECIES: lycopene cyclase family protein [Sphingobacterium]|uniref:Lycopene cyclase family protein n=1 Tax=Sphingobacterium populi TaxID=1812824 RepID=A0ABW5UEX6_9SPHI|nr:lycopene cyclase family protein [Sphingobacterium sp. CFCC 11742]
MERQQTGKNYNIAILGAGIAGVSLVLQGLKQNLWQDQSILLLGDSLDTGPNKRISFWAQNKDFVPEFPYLQWDKLAVISHEGNKIPLELDDYVYYSFDASAYRQHALTEIRKYKNVEVVEGTVQRIEQHDTYCDISSTQGNYQADYIFQTIYQKPILAPHSQYFLQHFTGWKIRTDQKFWNNDEAVIMDYRTSQEHGTSFIYGLPASDDEIFIEYTIFSKNLISKEEYAQKLSTYLAEVCMVSEYEVIETEYGVIPMTDHHFSRRDRRIYFLGSAGGDTRGSTGYTFTNTKRTIAHILQAFKQKTWPKMQQPKQWKGRFYDAILLHVLAQGKYPGHALFRDLFKNTRASDVFRFLDSQSDFKNDLRVMWSLQKWPFIVGMYNTLRLMIWKK